jgi:hypoxanthine phosphoribosyltransferase
MEEMMKELPSGLLRVIVSKKDIKQRVGEIAEKISNDYRDEDNLVVIGVLKGAFIFMADLCRRLNVWHTADFMAVSSYGLGGEESGAVRIIMDLRESITDRHVLIVEDILDSGATLNYLMRILGSRKPASLRTCVLLDKGRSAIETPVNYLGFTIPDVWVVGYGLDFAEEYRTLPYIAEIRKK